MTQAGGSGGYLLPAERSAQIFRDQIQPALLTGGTPGQHPAAVLVGGQPGAGKTALAALLTNSGTRPRVDVDMFRPFHPAHRRLRRADDLAADELVHADARRWFELALAHLTSRRVSLVAEHGLTPPLLDWFAARDYRIEVALLAVPAALSLLRILERYQIGREAAGTGRYVHPADHDRRYTQLLARAAALDADTRVSAVSVYDRHYRPIYLNERGPGGSWQRQPGTRAAVDAERSRAWTLAESDEFTGLLTSLHTRLPAHRLPSLADAAETARPLLHQARRPAPSRTGLRPAAGEQAEAGT